MQLEDKGKTIATVNTLLLSVQVFCVCCLRLLKLLCYSAVATVWQRVSRQKGERMGEKDREIENVRTELRLQGTTIHHLYAFRERRMRGTERYTRHIRPCWKM